MKKAARRWAGRPGDGAVLLALVMCSATAQANTIVVTDNDGSTGNDGLCSINEAVANATLTGSIFPDCVPGDAGPDTIELATDVTLVSSVAVADGSNGVFLIESTITIDGKGHTLRRDPSLACDIDTDNEPGEFRLLHVNAPNGSLTLENITLENGCVGGTGSADDGGAVFNRGELSVENSVFSMNSARGDGGGIFNDGTLTTISNNTFSGNSTRILSGGGIFNDGTLTTISNNTFSGNSSEHDGGAILNAGTITAISNNTFSGNSTDDAGGAISNNGTITAISNSTFSGNTADTGGGIYTSGGIVGLTNSIVTNTLSGQDCVVFGAGTIGNGNNNLIDDAVTDCPGRIVAVTDFDTTLQDHGCVTPGPTGCVHTHALLAGSNALDGAVGGTPADQRGFAAFGVRDIGAYEASDEALGPVPMLTTGNYIPGIFGFGFGDSQHVAVFAADFEWDGKEDRLLHLRALDADGDDELGVWLNGTPFGLLRGGPDGGAAMDSVFWVEKKNLVNGANRVEVRQRKPGNETWGVDRVGVFVPGVVWGNVQQSQQYQDSFHKAGFDLHLKGGKPKLLEVNGWDNNQTEATLAEIKLELNNKRFGRLPRSGAEKLGKDQQVYLPKKKLNDDNILLIHNAIDPEQNWGVKLVRLSRGNAKAGKIKGAIPGTRKAVNYLVPIDRKKGRTLKMQYNDVDKAGEVKVRVEKRKTNAPTSRNKRWVSESIDVKGRKKPRLAQVTVKTTTKKDRWGTRIKGWR